MFAKTLRALGLFLVCVVSVRAADEWDISRMPVWKTERAETTTDRGDGDSSGTPVGDPSSSEKSRGPASIETPEPQYTSMVQVVSLIADESGFFPSTVMLEPGKPVDLNITSTKTGLCFVVDSWGIRKGLVRGEKLNLKLPPQEKGVVKFHCAAGRLSGQFVFADPRKRK